MSACRKSGTTAGAEAKPQSANSGQGSAGGAPSPWQGLDGNTTAWLTTQVMAQADATAVVAVNARRTAAIQRFPLRAMQDIVHHFSCHVGTRTFVEVAADQRTRVPNVFGLGRLRAKTTRGQKRTSSVALAVRL
jgi:hypothetical protein